jgi:hypothetical protein
MRCLLVVACLVLATLPAIAADPLLPPPRPIAVAKPLNAADVRLQLGLMPDYAKLPRIKEVKVAVLDSGFAGADGTRPYLPADTVLVEHYDPEFIRRFDLGDPDFRRPLNPGDPHGRMLAQLVWAMTGNTPDGPKFYLLNANGPTLFRRAVRYAIEEQVDVILFAGTFEGAGNYDGAGPINAAVTEAVAAGIIWVNAAGNSGGMVYNGPIKVGPGGYLQFAGANGRTALWLRNRLDENVVTITLTWNDYRETEDAGTTKDLDLIVEDVRGQLIGQSTLRQVPPGQPAGAGETKNPRERLILDDLPAVPAGQEYRIRVKAKAGEFGPHDRIRILVTSARTEPVPDPITGKLLPPVDFIDASNTGEIYPPADHPGVITVGDTGRESSIGPTADGRIKPDVVLDVSTAQFSNGLVSEGSSNAAAYFAGVAAVLRAAEPGISTSHIKEWVRRLNVVAPRAVEAVVTRKVAIEPIPLTPNQERALRFATWAANDQQARGVPAPRVYVSGPGGETVVRPGGRIEPPPVRGVVQEAVVTRPRPPAAAPPTNRAPHAPWRTPPRGMLPSLVQFRP